MRIEEIELLESKTRLDELKLLGPDTLDKLHKTFFASHHSKKIEAALRDYFDILNKGNSVKPPLLAASQLHDIEPRVLAKYVDEYLAASKSMKTS